jgi:hypothetical protein
MKFQTLKATAYPIFSNWVTKAKIKFPTYSFQINEVSNFKSDLEHAIENAVFSLRKEEKANKRMTKGFDYGYFCGFIQGNLNAIWYYEYIYKQSNNYKLFAAVNTLDSFLKMDDLLKIRLSSLYSEYYKSQINLGNVNCKIAIDLPKNLDFLEIENLDNQILIALENIKIDIIKKMYDAEAPDFLTSVEVFFSKSEVDEIIELYR